MPDSPQIASREPKSSVEAPSATNLAPVKRNTKKIVIALRESGAAVDRCCRAAQVLLPASEYGGLDGLIELSGEVSSDR